MESHDRYWTCTVVAFLLSNPIKGVEIQKRRVGNKRRGFPVWDNILLFLLSGTALIQEWESNERFHRIIFY